jgi:hypothetical protein
MMDRLQRVLRQHPFDAIVAIMLVAMLMITLFGTRQYVQPAADSSSFAPNSMARPYTVESWRPDRLRGIAPAASITSNGWNGSDLFHSKIRGFSIIGSYRTGDADMGRLSLRLHRNDRVLFRSGPNIAHQRIEVDAQPSLKFDTTVPLAIDWVVLKFANPDLPRVFTVVFEDAGPGWGEWSAVALSGPPPTSPFTIEQWHFDTRLHFAGATAIVSNGWHGSDYYHSKLPGFSVIGSYRKSDADTGSLALRLHRNDQILFRTGPTAEQERITINAEPAGKFYTTAPLALDWVILDFSNPRLPKEFTAVFDDPSSSWGTWSAVALSTSPQRQRK